MEFEKDIFTVYKIIKFIKSIDTLILVSYYNNRLVDLIEAKGKTLWDLYQKIQNKFDLEDGLATNLPKVAVLLQESCLT